MAERKELYKDIALILRKMDYGEADRVYTLLTLEHGKLGAMAKSVRKPNAKLAPALQVYGEVEVVLSGGYSVEIITQAEIISPGARGINIEAAGYCALISEIIEKNIEERFPARDAYELCAKALKEINESTETRKTALWHLGKVVDWMGVAPNLSDCAQCGEEISLAPRPFSPTSGGLLCGKCSEYISINMSVPAQKILDHIIMDEKDTYSRLRFNAHVASEIEDAFTSQISLHMGKRIKSLEFLRTWRATQHMVLV